MDRAYCILQQKNNMYATIRLCGGHILDVKSTFLLLKIK